MVMSDSLDTSRSTGGLGDRRRSGGGAVIGGYGNHHPPTPPKSDDCAQRNSSRESNSNNNIVNPKSKSKSNTANTTKDTSYTSVNNSYASMTMIRSRAPSHIRVGGECASHLASSGGSGGGGVGGKTSSVKHSTSPASALNEPDKLKKRQTSVSTSRGALTKIFRCTVESSTSGTRHESKTRSIPPKTKADVILTTTSTTTTTLTNPNTVHENNSNDSSSSSSSSSDAIVTTRSHHRSHKTRGPLVRDAYRTSKGAEGGGGLAHIRTSSDKADRESGRAKVGTSSHVVHTSSSSSVPTVLPMTHPLPSPPASMTHVSSLPNYNHISSRSSSSGQAHASSRHVLDDCDAGHRERGVGGGVGVVLRASTPGDMRPGSIAVTTGLAMSMTATTTTATRTMSSSSSSSTVKLNSMNSSAAAAAGTATGTGTSSTNATPLTHTTLPPLTLPGNEAAAASRRGVPTLTSMSSHANKSTMPVKGKREGVLRPMSVAHSLAGAAGTNARTALPSDSLLPVVRSPSGRPYTEGMSAAAAAAMSYVTHGSDHTSRANSNILNTNNSVTHAVGVGGIVNTTTDNNINSGGHYSGSSSGNNANNNASHEDVHATSSSRVHGSCDGRRHFSPLRQRSAKSQPHRADGIAKDEVDVEEEEEEGDESRAADAHTLYSTSGIPPHPPPLEGEKAAVAMLPNRASSSRSGNSNNNVVIRISSPAHFVADAATHQEDNVMCSRDTAEHDTETVPSRTHTQHDHTRRHDDGTHAHSTTGHERESSNRADEGHADDGHNAAARNDDYIDKPLSTSSRGRRRSIHTQRKQGSHDYHFSSHEHDTDEELNDTFRTASKAPRRVHVHPGDTSRRRSSSSSGSSLRLSRSDASSSIRSSADVTSITTDRESFLSDITLSELSTSSLLDGRDGGGGSRNSLSTRASMGLVGGFRCLFLHWRVTPQVLLLLLLATRAAMWGRLSAAMRRSVWRRICSSTTISPSPRMRRGRSTGVWRGANMPPP